MSQHEKMDYVEFPAKDLEASKRFFETAFNWSFRDYGADYTSFKNEGLNGGFFKSDLNVSIEKGTALIVFYSDQLEKTQEKVKKAGGKIVKDIFSFPGGKRFHFTDPSNNEFAVWGE